MILSTETASGAPKRTRGKRRRVSNSNFLFFSFLFLALEILEGQSTNLDIEYRSIYIILDNNWKSIISFEKKIDFCCSISKDRNQRMLKAMSRGGDGGRWWEAVSGKSKGEGSKVGRTMMDEESFREEARSCGEDY